MTLLASFLAFGAPARADDAGTARELFTQGNTFYDLGQFDKAIDAWQRGYQLKNDPGFLYNIGQAYRTMGDAEKAIFFYKRYLINAPKAKNHSEVEQKIEALQKQVDERQAPPSGLAPAATGSAPVESAPSPTAPPPAPPPPPASAPAPVPARPAPVATAPAAAPAAVHAVAGAEPARPFDLGVSLGFDTWSSGLRTHAQPSFAFALDGGYTFGTPAARVRFRLGAIVSYTFLKENAWTDTFLSFLVDPTVVVRVTDRARVSADLGLGWVAITGLQPTSTLLTLQKPPEVYKIDGSGVPRGVLRFGVAGEYDLMPGLSVFVWPAVASSPKTGKFYGSLTRVEVLFGAAYRF